MNARLGCIAIFLIAAAASFAAPPPEPFPRAAAGYRADGRPESYDRETVYKYMDGGAEIYLEYGMKSLAVQRYAKKGEPPIVFDLFEMDSPAGAFGAFTFEREDDEAGLGQGSEYGGGLLRFWQGRYFGFIQTERETPASKEAVLALGKAVAKSLDSAGAAPDLPRVLGAADLRPKSVRYIRSPLLLEVLEPQFGGNPLGLTRPCDAVLGRYGAKGNTERAVVVRLSDEKASQAAVQSLLRAWTKGSASSGEPIPRGDTWTAAERSGPFVVVILGASDAAAASSRVGIVAENLKGGNP